MDQSQRLASRRFISCNTGVSPAFQMLLLLAVLAAVAQQRRQGRRVLSEGLMQLHGSALAFWHNTTSFCLSSR